MYTTFTPAAPKEMSKMERAYRKCQRLTTTEKSKVLYIPEGMDGDNCEKIFKRAYAGAQALCARHQKNMQLMAFHGSNFIFSDGGYWSGRKVVYSLEFQILSVSNRCADEWTYFRVNNSMKDALERRQKYVENICTGLENGTITEWEENSEWDHINYYCDYKDANGGVIHGEEYLSRYPEVKYTMNR
jgi:hypothetical protein